MLRFVARNNRHVGHGVIAISSTVFLCLVANQAQYATYDISNNKLLWAGENQLASNILDAFEEGVDVGPLRFGDDLEENVGCCNGALFGTTDLSSLEKAVVHQLALDHARATITAPF